MTSKLGLALLSVALLLGCGESKPLRSGSSTPASPDAAAGGGGGGRQDGAITGQSQAGQSGAAGGQIENPTGGSNAGGAQLGGASAITGVGGTTTSTGGNSRQGGTTSTGTGTSLPGGTGGTGVAGGGGTAGSTSMVGGTTVVAGSSTSSRGGGTTGGSSTVKGGTTMVGGSSAGGTGGSVKAGTTAVAGGNSGGATTGGVGGTATGGQTINTSPANDAVGQDPFTRTASSGILITSSDGLNSINLLLAADSKGGMFMAGATRNPQAMGLTAFDSGIESEAFAARLDPQGQLVWSVPLKTCGVPADIAAGPDDTVFVLCPYEPAATSLMPSTCDAAAVVDKLAGADGKLLFEARVKPPAQPADGYMCPYGLGVDGQGRSYVGGNYTPSIQNTRSILIAVTATGQQDWTVVSEGPTGSPTTDSAVSYVNDVDVDTNGNVLFVGTFNTWTKWGTTQLTSQAMTGQWSSYNGYFARVAADGSNPTAWRFGGTVFDLGTALAPTGDGGFVLGGWVSGSTSVGGKPLTAPENGSAMIAQITSTGQATWAKALPGDSITDDVALGPDGKVYFVGQFANDEILYSYDPASDSLTSRKTVAGTATANEMRTRNVAVSSSGSLWLSGSFKGTINLGTGALSTSTVATFLFKIH